MACSGPNGCGNTTAINILYDLLDADGGTVEIAGEVVPKLTRRRIGACPQEIARYQDLHPLENLHFLALVYGLSGAERKPRVAELIQRIKLEPYARTRVFEHAYMELLHGAEFTADPAPDPQTIRSPEAIDHERIAAISSAASPRASRKAW
jgi:ABC-type Na+ transport system ATPase subunit NatA